MDITALENKMNTLTKYDILGNSINIGDIICAADRNAGSCWLNIGIVLDVKNFVLYLHLDNKTEHKIFHTKQKILIINKNYSLEEIKSFKEIAENFKEEKKLKKLKKLKK